MEHPNINVQAKLLSLFDGTAGVLFCVIPQDAMSFFAKSRNRIDISRKRLYNLRKE